MGVDNQHVCALDHGHYLHAQVKTAFNKMHNAAKLQNIDVQICSSYRAFDRQLSIWNRKWVGELPVYNLLGNKLNLASLSDEQKIHAIMLYSALPGASRHHWGTDFDVYDKAEVEKRQHKFELLPSEYESNGPCALLSQWLQENAHTFGFMFPYATYRGGVAREPWHLSFAKIANNIEQQFNINDLYKLLEKSDILGKESILIHLPDLVEQYTFNKGNRTCL